MDVAVVAGGVCPLWLAIFMTKVLARPLRRGTFLQTGHSSGRRGSWRVDSLAIS